MRVAIVHYWLVGQRGGEKVVEALLDLYPEADIFTHVVDRDAISEKIRARPITTSFISRLPAATRRYKQYLPLMPMALEGLDLSSYDLVISSESGPAKGIIPSPTSLHVCYCHSPMRYIWNLYGAYRESADLVTRWSMPPVANYLRTWDVTTAARVDWFMANSANVANRVLKYYRRQADVVCPPVDVERFAPVGPDELGDYYLMVGELVGYKRPDLAVAAFNASGKRLVVIGGGEMLAKLSAMAGPNVVILGPQPFEVLVHHYSRCKALIFPGEEDFGLVPIEAMASGRPVVALDRGGALETVVDGETGVYFGEQSIESLTTAVNKLEAQTFDSTAIVAHARRFEAARFKSGFLASVERAQEAQDRLRHSRAPHGFKSLRTPVVLASARATRSALAPIE